MKRSELLKVIPDTGFAPGKLVMHPNEGYDLGLMRQSHDIEVCINQPLEAFSKGSCPHISGSLFLENECRHGVVEMSKKQWTEMGRPDQVLVVHNDGRILLLSKPKNADK